MLQNAYFLAKIGVDQPKTSEILPNNDGMYGSPYSIGGGAPAYAGGLGTYRGGYAPAMPYGAPLGRTAPVFRTRSSVPT